MTALGRFAMRSTSSTHLESRAPQVADPSNSTDATYFTKVGEVRFDGDSPDLSLLGTFNLQETVLLAATESLFSS